MEQSHKSKMVECLKADVEKKAGRMMESPKDFQLLLDMLPPNTPLSISTLKRLWHYVANTHEPRESTLAILARFTGYDGWTDFCIKHKDLSDSDFICGMNTVRDIPSNAIIELEWKPDRVCRLIKTKDGHFRVNYAINAKLMTGDEFFTAWIERGKPMVATKLRRNGLPLPDYVAGKKEGLTSITIIENNINNE